MSVSILANGLCERQTMKGKILTFKHWQVYVCKEEEGYRGGAQSSISYYKYIYDI